MCLIAPFVVFLSANGYRLLAVEVLPYYVACGLIGVAVAAAARLSTKLGQLALWACLLAAILLLYQVGSVIALLVALAATGGAILLLRRNAAHVILAAAGAHVLSTVVLGAARNPPPPVPAQIEAADESLPPVLHVVLDELAGPHGLPAELPGSARLVARIVESYPAFGFSLHARAYSEYFGTADSLSNELNFSSRPDYRPFTTRGDEDIALSANAYFEHLRRLGYVLRVHQSTYLDFCSTPAAPVAACSTYDRNTIAAIAGIAMSAPDKTLFITRSFVDASTFLGALRVVYGSLRERLRLPLPDWQTGNSRTGPLTALPTVERLERELEVSRGGEAHFAHLLLPHYPYNLNADCSPKTARSTWLQRAPLDVIDRLVPQNDTESRALRYAEYLEQYECALNVLERLFAALRRSGQWDRAVVIVQGDHGSRIVRVFPGSAGQTDDDFRDAYSTFFAAKVGLKEGRVSTAAAPLPELLAEAWGLPAPPAASAERYVYVPQLSAEEMVAVPLAGFAPEVPSGMR